ncbi:SAM-dependent methyltransferase [Calidithermus chliarophilus]|uniref:SAM-dependent methyltransferase n=1 Tax=Calidithermus chliarophilus TaxID=52023 RepID=UPI0003FCD546|nr:cyclopropane-fatty-acyl-phospholipid synthase family protein [Calidithermus chliarophilus]
MQAGELRRLLERVLPARPFEVRLWDGSVLPATAEPKATLVLGRGLLEGLAPPLDLALGEAFVRGDLEVEGDLGAVLAALEHVELPASPLEWVRGVALSAAGVRGLGARLHGAAHSLARDRQAVQHHYDLSNDFYRLWLDARMVYSCAYFPRGDETIEQAQEAKLELICRKLRLRPGERLLDVGCGWGGLVVYAAERYGVEAVGITLSQTQLEEARARVRQRGLEGRVRVEALDYREVRGRFDKVASVGMAEHVGRANLGRYFQAALACLEPGGLFLHHAIARGPVPPKSPAWAASGEFMRRYVFPDGEILPLWEMLREAETAGFEVRDVEDLREHYARTLEHWRQRLEARLPEATALVGPERTRLYRLYLTASAHQFAFGHLAIHQSLLAKPDARGRVNLPPTRADLYRE